MDFSEFNISKQQAKEFAKAIFADIEAYVNEHVDEFEEFLRNEEREDDNNVRIKRNNKSA